MALILPDCPELKVRNYQNICKDCHDSCLEGFCTLSESN